MRIGINTDHMYSYRLLCNIAAFHSIYYKHSMPIISFKASCVMRFPCFPQVQSKPRTYVQEFSKIPDIKKEVFLNFLFPAFQKR